MQLSLHAVVFTREAETGMKLLKSKYGENSYEVKESVMLVASNNLSSDIAKFSSIAKSDADDGVRGAVFKLNGSYAGYAQGSLWEWLENVSNS